MNHLSVRPYRDDALALQATDRDRTTVPGQERLASIGVELVRQGRMRLLRFDDTKRVEVRLAGRSIPCDGLPVVGWAVGCDGLHAVATNSDYTLALELAHLVADEVAGRTGALFDPYCPSRFASEQTPASVG